MSEKLLIPDSRRVIVTDYCTNVGGGGTGFDGASTTLGPTAEDFGVFIRTWMPRSKPGSVGADRFLS